MSLSSTPYHLTHSLFGEGAHRYGRSFLVSCFAALPFLDFFPTLLEVSFLVPALAGEMSFNAGQDLYGTQYSVPQEGNFGMGPQPQQNQPSERSHTLPGATDPRFAPAYTGNIPYGANFSTYPHPNFPIGTPLQNSTSLGM